jgi:hypothetical protein
MAFPIAGNAQDIKGLGVSKREFFSAILFHAILSNPDSSANMFIAASDAVKAADILIDTLVDK